MDSKRKTDEKSKRASGSHSHSSYSKQSNKKVGREENFPRMASERNQGGKEKSSKNSDHTGSNDRNYNSYNQKYQNHRKSHTRNRDSSRHSEWDRNKYCNRNDRWNSSRPRYSNLSWQRSDLNHRNDRYHDSRSRSHERPFLHEREFIDYTQDTLSDRLRFDRVSEPSEEQFNQPLATNKDQPGYNQRQESHPVVDKSLERRNPFKTCSRGEQETPDRNFFEPCPEGFEIKEIEEPSGENVGTPWVDVQTFENQEAPELYHFGDQTLQRPDEIIPKIERVGLENQFEDLAEPLTDFTENFDLRNCLNVDINNSFPSISVVPISRLIKSELQDLNRTEIIAPVCPAQKKSTLRPNLVKRKKKTSLSENLVQRVANMDKVGIKNVINNAGTKYDAALKIQARKQLREEIRKQLKSMNFTPPENSENCVVVPDEIVDSMNIPAVLLDEIRKAFGIVLVEDVKIISERDEPSEKSAINEPQSEAESKTQEASKSPDLMSRLKMLEEVKSQSEKSPPAKTEPPLKKRSKSNKDSDDVVVINSSSSSSSSSSSDSDSDTSSTSSGSSTTSSFKRRRRKKRILEANVVGNFEKLILPYLSDNQRRRYKRKYSKTTKNSLHYIYVTCVTRANLTASDIDPKERLKHKRNLTSADNAQALEFLMKAILNLFEQQKEQRRKGKDNPPSPQSKGISKCSNPVSTTKNSQDSTCNQRNSDNEQEKEQIATAADSAENAEQSKHQSTKVDDAPPEPSVGGVNRNEGNSINESANSAQGVSSSAAPADDDERLVARNSESDSELENETSNGICPPSRLWKSPGEKKCVEMETPPSLGSLGMMQPPLGIHSLDLDSLRSQSTIGDEAVNSIREIDVKLMELHKRKMYIEEMILKLQKDKMEVDLWTMKLQNEKFILLNSALATASSSSAAPASACKSEKKPKPSVKRKLTSTSGKVQNQKKLCQRDTGSSKTSNLMQKPRQTRRSARSTTVKNESEQSSITETVAETKTDQVIVEKDNSDLAEEPTVEVAQVDYSEVPNGSFEGWKLPITQIIVVGESIIAASEDGNIYKFNIRTRALESKFSKHTEAITQIFTCPRENSVYTTSLDGFLKKTSIENFGLEIQSLNIQEPLQSIDIEWGTAFIGSRWGNIFTFDIKSNSLSESLLCSSGSSIIAIKATKEGPRKILIVSSKGNQINFRDAMTGLLLRSLDVPNNLHIYSILLDDGCVFCGTQRNEIYQYNFTTGGRLAIFNCGNGAVSMKLYKDKYIFVGCYDGFVYVLDKTTGCQIGRFPGSGKMILALDIAGDKLITSAKDNTMQIIDIPKYIVIKEKT